MSNNDVIRMLRKIGFSKQTFTETILVVYFNGKVVASPTGFLLRSSSLYARIYKGSRLYSIFEHVPESILICIPSNSLLFYYSILRREKLVFRKLGNYYTLKGCSIDIPCSLLKTRNRSLYRELYLKPEAIVINEPYPRGYRRVDYAVVEALVYYTKIPYVSIEEAENYVKALEYVRWAVYRSTRNNKYRRIIDEIVTGAREVLEKRLSRKASLGRK
ncbi:MAG: hypothetical protein ABWW65_03965 [Thermoprotei archaeon]